MQLTNEINTYGVRLFWGQLKKKIGIIKPKPWTDNPFWEAWFNDYTKQELILHDQCHQAIEQRNALSGH